MHPRLFSRCLLLYGILCLSSPAQAAVDHVDMHDKRAALARSFVEKLKNKLPKAEPSPRPAIDSSPEVALIQIPEGADMLFRPQTDKYTLEDNIFALKGADEFYL